MLSQYCSRTTSCSSATSSFPGFTFTHSTLRYRNPGFSPHVTEHCKKQKCSKYPERLVICISDTATTIYYKKKLNEKCIESYLGPNCDSPIKLPWLFLVKFEQSCRADLTFALFAGHWSGISGTQRIVHSAGDQSSSGQTQNLSSLESRVTGLGALGTKDTVT